MRILRDRQCKPCVILFVSPLTTDNNFFFFKSENHQAVASAVVCFGFLKIVGRERKVNIFGLSNICSVGRTRRRWLPYLWSVSRLEAGSAMFAHLWFLIACVSASVGDKVKTKAKTPWRRNIIKWKVKKRIEYLRLL